MAAYSGSWQVQQGMAPLMLCPYLFKSLYLYYIIVAPSVGSISKCQIDDEKCHLLLWPTTRTTRLLKITMFCKLETPYSSLPLPGESLWMDWHDHLYWDVFSVSLQAKLCQCCDQFHLPKCHQTCSPNQHKFAFAEVLQVKEVHQLLHTDRF